MIYALEIQKVKMVGAHFMYSAKDALDAGGK